MKNKVVGTLSSRPHLLYMFSANVAGSDSLKTEYAKDEDFGNLWNDISTKGCTFSNEYLLCDGFLFYKSCLCVPHDSFQEFLTT